ncbi:MAG: hypothetical protein PUF12_10345 [Thermoflexaceae bacterium]|nr:hypothetical protein [Thermoflexaceae bacterium]
MFKKLLLEQVISFENSFNGFIYFLRELPFFEKRISYEFFQHNKFKHVLSIVTFIFGIFVKFLGRLVYAAAFLMIPYIILKQFVVGNTFQYEETVINIFFMMNCVCGSLVNTVILSSSDEDYMMLNVLKINPKEHYVGELLFKLIVDFFVFFGVLCIFDIGVLNSLILVILMTAFRCIGELLSLLIYSKIPYIYKRIVNFDVIVILVCVYFAYVNPFLRGKMVSVDAFAFNPVLLGVICSLGLISLIILCNYKYYPRLARKRVKRVDTEYAEEIQARSRIREVKAKHNVTGTAALCTNRHERKAGYSYLNNIFFDRNKKLLLKSPNKRIIWLLAITVVLIAYLLTAGSEAKEKIWNTMIGMDTVWFFIMYLLSCSHRMCRAIFYNCDKDMMRYSYYTKKSALVANFIVRLKKFILIDLRTAGVIIIGMCIVTALTEHLRDFTAVVPGMIIVVLFSILASIYHVAMYHVIQPYNEHMKVKKPMFTICNVLIGIIGLVFWELPMNAAGVMVVQLIGIVALMVFAYVLVKEFGPDNFYVK